MEISWKAFFVLWAVTIIANFCWDARAGAGMIGLAAAAIIMRLAGYERGWRRFTVMPFLSAILLMLMLIGHLIGR